MNILILTTHINPGGISRYCLNLAKELKTRGNTVWVGSSGGTWEEELKNAGVNHLKLPINIKSFFHPKIFANIAMLVPIIKTSRVEIIHANTRVTQFLAMLLSKICGIPYISTYHGFYKPGLFRTWFKFSGTLSIAVSKAVKEHIIHDLRVSEKSSRVIYNGVDSAQFSPRVNTKINAGFDSQDFVIGILGRISEEKGHLLAVQAMRLVVKRRPNVKLLICGTGKIETKVQESVKKSRLSEHVRFINLPADEFFNIIDLLIMPSRKEGFGFAIIEAFAKNVPVIGYDVGGITEIVRDRINGLLFYSYDPRSLENAIDEMIGNPGMCQRFIQASADDLAFFSLSRMVSDTEIAYKDAIQKYT